VNLDDLPVVGAVVDAGPDDPVFDALLLAGLPIVVLILAVGRSVVTEAIAAAYLAVLVAYVGYRWLRGRD
jgi:hypothetical protein